MEIESEKIDSFYESIVSGKILRLSIFLTPCHETEEMLPKKKKLVKILWVLLFTKHDTEF